ncbi:hypothetical protein Vadar_000847 [Vaccinium darrowii]|uniref:Uncharacterized protein n=1 Tax=Vaccinium darrowii TaxID=229202 RepID=A0ACB7XXG1_9ERIC|nr:hypothetical protein Vadar_000847 [Vaccinium darrowii]
MAGNTTVLITSKIDCSKTIAPAEILQLRVRRDQPVQVLDHVHRSWASCRQANGRATSTNSGATGQENPNRKMWDNFMCSKSRSWKKARSRVSATEFTLQNLCGYTVWAGTLCGNGAAVVGGGGFALAPAHQPNSLLRPLGRAGFGPEQVATLVDQAMEYASLATAVANFSDASHSLSVFSLDSISAVLLPTPQLPTPTKHSSGDGDDNHQPPNVFILYLFSLVLALSRSSRRYPTIILRAVLRA